MNILIDSNIALDILLNRQPHYVNAAHIFRFTEKGVIKSYISASAITDIYYIARKAIGKEQTKESLKTILHVFHPADVTESHIYQALEMDWKDFEDSVQYVVGENFPVDYIVTRNIKDYSKGSIPVVTSEQFVQMFAEDDEEK